jgi:murein DD-endopeptidase MepM/ murein hydrolase activator NlpD
MAWTTSAVSAAVLLAGAATLLAPANGQAGDDELALTISAPAPASGADAVRKDPGVGTAPLDRPARVRHRWPTGSPAVVVRSFQPPPERWTSGHRGVDLELAPTSPVLTSAHGVVAFAGSVAGRPLVSVAHPDGIRTTYEPVIPAVRAGDQVSAGTVLGRLATSGTHCDPASCLHWGARVGRDQYIDPLTLLDDVVIRLFPDG